MPKLTEDEAKFTASKECLGAAILCPFTLIDAALGASTVVPYIGAEGEPSWGSVPKFTAVRDGMYAEFIGLRAAWSASSHDELAGPATPRR